jgi:hypothetical protein
MKPTPTCLVLLGVAGVAHAQSMVDLTDVRNVPRPYASVFEVEAGAVGTRASESGAAATAAGLDDAFSWDGHVYYRDESFSSRRGTLEAYAGRDGLYGSFADGKVVGDDTVTRFEVRARPWQFYRDGFYRGKSFVPNGLYEGSDYEGYIGFGREAQQGLYVELGPYYKQLKFKTNELTSSDFTIPDNHSAYGGRLYLEQNTVQMDRRRGMPRDGFVLTLIGEREWNDSDAVIGNSIFATELPSAVWRVRGRLEWYVPSSDDATWEIFAHGGWQDEKDLLQNTEAQRPLGSQWADAQLRLRLNLGDSMTLSPFVQGQYSQVLGEDGGASTRKFFFGAGVETYIHFSDSISLHGYYSFVDNESRPSIKIDEDVHGEHMFYLGMVVRFGATRR